MKIIRIVFSLLTILSTMTMFAMVARADEDAQLTFNAPIRLPGNMLLPAGTYWFSTMDGLVDPDVVVIQNSDRSHVIATFLTKPEHRTIQTTGTQITLAERGRKRPNTLLSWFDEGMKYGHDFVYSNRMQRRLNEEHVLVCRPGREPAVNSPLKCGGAD